MNAARSAVFACFVALLVGGFFLLAVELVLRRFIPPPKFLKIQEDRIALLGMDRVNSEAYRGYDWARDYLEAARALPPDAGLRYEPFSLWAHKPVRSRYVNYLDSGYRLTVNPAKTARVARVVWVFGGSTVAGDGILRDEDLIPSRLSAMLNASYPDAAVEVFNYAQSGFNQGNTYHLLMELLGRGGRPDLVVFYEGFNDVSHQVYAGYPHMAYETFDTITAFWSGASAFRVALRQQLKRSRLMGVVIPGLRRDAPIVTGAAQATERSRALAERFRGRMTVARRLGDALGFRVLFALQPTVFHKEPRTREEDWIMKGTLDTLPFLREGIDQTYALAAGYFSTAELRPVFLDATRAFNTPRSLFVDPVHVSPAGNELAARALADRIVAGDLLKLGGGGRPS